MSGSRDIAIVGAGLVTALGGDLATTWDALLAGRSGIGHIRRFDASGFATQIAGEIEGAAGVASALLHRPAASLKEQLAFRALEQALVAAQLSPPALPAARTGLFTGCENGGFIDVRLFADYDTHGATAAVVERHHRDLLARKPDAVLQALRALVPSAVVACNYSMACAASAVAISQALRWLRRGAIDRAIVVAADTPIHPVNVHGFGLLGALSTHNDDPARASRPFDARRGGFVLAEGAGALVLETMAAAAARRAVPLARLTGVGITNNQSHITNTPRSGEHAGRAMQRALDDAGLRAADIGYINAHGTSTDIGDIGETAAVQQVFAAPPPVSSTKSMTGHLVAVMAVRHGRLPPTINQDEPDPECLLDYVANAARTSSIEHAMSNSFGFGGTNVSLIVSRAAP